MAEVLITLGVIGVVAALTLPTLIQNYQKKLVAKRLAHFSSVMQQGAKMRTAQSMDGTFVAMEPLEVAAFNPDDMLRYIDRYWKPYVKFNKTIKLQKGVLALLANGSGAYFVRTAALPDSNSVATRLYIVFCPEYKHCKNIEETTQIAVNKMDDGKTRFTFYNDGRPERTGVKEKTREELITTCKNTPSRCGALIERDGWEIRDDYPW